MDLAINSKTCLQEHNILLEWQYSIVSEKFYRPELGEYHTYGIQAQAPVHTYIVHDVSTCEKTAKHIVGLLNLHRASPVHIYDIVADMLP